MGFFRQQNVVVDLFDWCGNWDGIWWISHVLGGKPRAALLIRISHILPGHVPAIRHVCVYVAVGSSCWVVRALENRNG